VAEPAALALPLSATCPACIAEPEKAANLLSDAMVAAEGDAIKRSNISVPLRPAKSSGALITKTA
jgi:hypothetical protein